MSTRAAPQPATLTPEVVRVRSDAELLRVLFEASEARSSDLLDCGGPAPGCSLYGFMFDLQLAPTAPAAAVALTGLQVFASHADCDYAVFVAEGTWRRKDEIHLPGSKHSCADAVKWRFVTTSPAIPSAAGGAAEDGTGGLLEAGCPIRPHALWLLLQEPILLRKDSTTAVYIHSQTSWGAICYRSSPRTKPAMHRCCFPCLASTSTHLMAPVLPRKNMRLCDRMLDDTGCQVAPGVETASDRNMRVLTGTFTQV